MDRPIPIPIGLPGGIKQLRVERNKADEAWMIWLSANSEWTCGTFIELRDWGGINRVTWHPDGSESVFVIREDSTCQTQ